MLNILELYYVPISGKGIYKIKIETLLKCPNKEEANKQSKLVTKLSSQTAVITSSENSIFYSNYKAMSILGINILNKSSKNAVRYLNTSSSYIEIIKILFRILLKRLLHLIVISMILSL